MLTLASAPGSSLSPGNPYQSAQLGSPAVGSAGVLKSTHKWVRVQATMSSWKFRHVVWVTSVIRIVASFFDIIIVKRWNVVWHIPDKARLPTSALGLGLPLTTHGSWRALV